MITLSYLELYNLLRTEALAMNQVNDFVWATMQEIFNKEDLNYPMIGFEADTLVTATDASEEYRLAFYVLDRNFEDVSKRIQVLAKTKIIGQMFILQLYGKPEYRQMFIEPVAFNMTPIVDDFADRVTGWRFELNINLKFTFSICDLLNIFDGLNQTAVNIQEGNYLLDGDPEV